MKIVLAVVSVLVSKKTEDENGNDGSLS